ncbi:hypothetical protein [Arsenicibacter rosenii]|uniref:hypothetical protein n=1 Tax=Arsenicibacter rosenii TaxID=1750698 RepID=UPI0040430BA8
MNHIWVMLVLGLASFSGQTGYGQAVDPAWQIEAKDINPARYFGITVANGMIGLVSSPEPMKVKDVVLNGAFDTYGRGRVSNILTGNLLRGTRQGECPANGYGVAASALFNLVDGGNNSEERL